MSPKCNTIDDVWKYIDKKGSYCWEWTRFKNPSGYGMFAIKHKMYLSHRLAYESIYGNIPNNLCVLHKCDNPSCCNPEHLFLGTQKENVNDMVNKNRQQKGESNGSNKLSENDIKEIRRLYKCENYTQRELSKKFCVDKSHIHNIVNMIKWKYLK